MASNRLEYLSSPTEVSMGDAWFEVVSLDHFWIQRRFSVIKKLCSKLILEADRLAEIGCGNGLVQRQIEDFFFKNIDGYDLNEEALKQNVSIKSKVICYDILDKNKEVENIYDVIIKMDVLEHIKDENEFLKAASFMLKPGGYLIINVPAFQSMYSDYDKMVGHVRRYDAKHLIGVVSSNGFGINAWSYWGLPLVPILWLRTKFIHATDQKACIERGMSPRSSLINWGLQQLTKLEPIPQKFYGTSLMAVYQKQF